ncbi:hypothetical protein CK203_107598 [Vitis vinifera]|uniref:Uncharacterized protein n=1 Tax=Vitis vinifera TaxID=29760 RepID=A0A438FEG6_VITVI|nr:hypothetical protein CK203_107598 [Vitis vinifera]
MPLGFGDMSSPPKICPDFFTVYLPELSWDRLRIPTAFVEHFNGFMPEKAILRDFVGRVWHVECEKKDTKVVDMDIYKKDFCVKEKDVEEAEGEEEEEEEEEKEEEEEERKKMKRRRKWRKMMKKRKENYNQNLLT